MARILIADDDPQVLRTLAEVVKALGHEVQTAPDGRQALEHFFAGSFDLVLTDLAMPEVDGLQVLNRVKAARPSIGVIVLTGNSTMELLAAAINRGVDAYITKPFKISEIDSQLRRVLAKNASPEPKPEAAPEPRKKGLAAWLTSVLS